MELLRQAVRHPDDARAHFNLANALARLGKWEEAAVEWGLLFSVNRALPPRF